MVTEERGNLTREAKDEIHAYMWKSIALPAIPAAILTFLIGYFWNDIALVKAENNAAAQYRAVFNKLTDDAYESCLLYTSPSPRDQRGSRMPSSA